MRIENRKEVEDTLLSSLGDALEGAVKKSIENIVQELPKGAASSIAGELIYKRVDERTIEVYCSQTWTYLNDGTGIYSTEHRGHGPGGAIVPIRAKALHFHNGVLAAALGFPDENVFLLKVKGITPRFYWDRHFSSGRLAELMR